MIRSTMRNARNFFFKATPHRTVGNGGTVRIRRDSKWNVPEPELTLFICSEGTIEGYTIGNEYTAVVIVIVIIIPAIYSCSIVTIGRLKS